PSSRRSQRGGRPGPQPPERAQHPAGRTGAGAGRRIAPRPGPRPLLGRDSRLAAGRAGTVESADRGNVRAALLRRKGRPRTGPPATKERRDGGRGPPPPPETASKKNTAPIREV